MGRAATRLTTFRVMGRSDFVYSSRRYANHTWSKMGVVCDRSRRGSVMVDSLTGSCDRKRSSVPSVRIFRRRYFYAVSEPRTVPIRRHSFRIRSRVCGLRAFCTYRFRLVVRMVAARYCEGLRSDGSYADRMGGATCAITQTHVAKKYGKR